MLKKFRIVLLFAPLIIGFAAFRVEAKAPEITVLTASGTVNPVLAGYIERGITAAEDRAAVCCIIRLDTPGGLDTAMRDIVGSIINSEVPVVVYVSPAGSRAASAGVFITVAAHVAVMAPNTVIGAASPVAIGPGGESELSETMSNKILNDAAAYIRSLAAARGRNLEWAEKAVREAVSATEQEALELKVIDLVSPTLDDLITRLNGREVKLLSGNTVTLATSGTYVNFIDMTAAEKLLHTIADPNIAYLLLGLAFLGIVVEIFNPPLIFPGVIGGIAGILAFYSLGMLPVNYAGVLFILLAFGLFIAEVFTPGFGLLTAGGVVSLIIGSLILFQGSSLLRPNPYLIATVIIIVVAATVFAVRMVARTRRLQPATGKEELIGKTAKVRTPLNPEGLVWYNGELWTAVTGGESIGTGEEVTITKVVGLTLHVTKKNEKGEKER